METEEFEAALVEQGYRDIETKSLLATYRAKEHSHSFDVRALVLAGEITLTVDGRAHSFERGVTTSGRSSKNSSHSRRTRSRWASPSSRRAARGADGRPARDPGPP